MSAISPQVNDWVIDGFWGIGKIIRPHPQKPISYGYFLDPANENEVLIVPVINTRIKKIIADEDKKRLFEQNLQGILLEGGI